MGAGNMDGPAGREMSRRMRSNREGSFQFGAGNEIGGFGAPDPAFADEGDLSEPGKNSPDPDALRAVAGANKKRAAKRAEARQAKFFSMKDDENMPGAGQGNPGMQMSPGPDMKPPGGYQGGFDFDAMMGGPKQQAEEAIQTRQPVPGQSLQAGQQAAQIRESLMARRGAEGKRRMPTMDDEYLSL